MAGKTIILQERDIALFLHIYNAKVVSSAEIGTLFFSSVPFAYKRLLQLVDAGYLVSKTYSLEHRRYAGKYYRLTQQSLNELVLRKILNNSPLRATRIISSNSTVIFLLKLGEVRTALIKSGTITLGDWQFPRDVRDLFEFTQFTPVCCRIHDIMVLHVFSGASKYLNSTVELANRLTSVACEHQQQINHVVIVYETRKESVRLLEQYVSGPVYMSTFAQLPTLLTDLLTGKPAYHMNELISRYHALHPRATFGPPLLGTVEAMPNGLTYEPKVLLADGITGSIFAKQEFLRAPKECRVELVRQGTDLLLSSELPAPTSTGKVLRATSKLG